MASMVSAFHHTRLYITNEILLQHQVVSDCAFALHALDLAPSFVTITETSSGKLYECIMRFHQLESDSLRVTMAAHYHMISYPPR